VSLARVATNTSLSAANAQRRFRFADASTDVDAVLDDTSIDAVFVVTRHHSHADLVCRALEAGKATFVEKPLALSEDELQRILTVVRSTGNDRLMVGFNRRFAPLLVELRHRFGDASGQAVLHYRVNAGPLEASSWYADAGQEGSRFTGEGGHFLDTASWWFDARPEEVLALSAGGDGLHACVRFDGGSIATVDYLTNGNPRCPKEAIEVSADGRTARVDNFRRATLWSGRRRQVMRARGPIDKGQAAQLARFLQAVKSGGAMPIDLSSLVATTRATLAVQRSLEEGAAVPVG
jgi:predicted dehydrogenase